MSALRLVFIGLLAALAPVRAANVLYFRDAPIAADRLAEAVDSLGLNLTVTGDPAEFQTQLASGDFEVGVFFVQNRAAADYAPAIQALRDFVAGGGRALYADWSQNATLAEGFGAGFTANVNDPAVFLDDLQPGTTLVINPMKLRNTGWFNHAAGLTALPGSTVAAHFSNGDAAIVRGPNGRSLVYGFLSDTPACASYFRRGIEAVLGTPGGPQITGSSGASNIGVHSATVNGAEQPNYAETDVIIDFGITGTYGQQTPPMSIGAGPASVPVAITLTGLSAHTLHHYRIRAVSSVSDATTGDITFTTLDTPPVAVADRFTGTQTSAFDIDPLRNDSDADQDALSITATTNGQFGTVTFTSAKITYTPGIAGLREDQFTYTIDDGFGGTATATVAIDLPLDRFHAAYSQLLTGPAGIVGRIDLVFTRFGSFTGALLLDARRYTISGVFDASGSVRVVKHQQGAPDLVVTLDMRLATDGPRLTGEVSTGVNAWPLDVGGVLYESQSPPFATGGRFTLIVPDAHQSGVPRGDAWVMFAGSPDGHLRLTGSFADGHPFIGDATMQPDGTLPLYLARSRAPAEYLAGTLQFAANKIDGPLMWTRIGSDAFDGFSAASSARGSLFKPPKDGTPIFKFTDPARPHAVATLTADDLGLSLHHSLDITLGRIFVRDPAADGFRLRFSRTTGRFTGGFTDPSLGSARIGGVLLQRDNVVRGNFFGGDFSGVFLLIPR